MEKLERNQCESKLPISFENLITAATCISLRHQRSLSTSWVRERGLFSVAFWGSLGLWVVLFCGGLGVWGLFCVGWPKKCWVAVG